MTQTIHRAVGADAEGIAYRARCGLARFEGGFTEPMQITRNRREVTCDRCRTAKWDGAVERVVMLALLVAVLAVGFGELAWVRFTQWRGRRDPRTYGRPGAGR